MTRNWLVSLVAVAALALSGGAFAQTQTPGVPAFYIGAEVGQGEAADEDDFGYKILGGYQFHRNFAGEIGYGVLLDKENAEVTALEFVGVGLWPLGNNFHLLGKLGLANWEIESRGRGTDGTDLTWGLGAQFDMGRNLGLRATWQRYEADEEIDFLNLGLLWKF
jgi:hypothetical protein